MLVEKLRENNLQQIDPQEFGPDFCHRTQGGKNEKNKPLLFSKCREENTATIEEIVNNLDDPEMVRQAYEMLVEIGGVSHKIASLILRDLSKFPPTRFADPENIPPEIDVYWRMQPVDTHVSFVAPTLGLCEEGDDDETKAMEICNKCIEAKVNPLWFNSGAWGVNSMRVQQETLKWQLEQLEEAIQDYFGQEMLKEIQQH